MQIEKYEKWLSQFPSGSQERMYFRDIFELLEALSPPHTEVSALGCMIMLVNTDVRLKDGRRIPDNSVTNMGTIGDVSEAIAVYFADVEPRAIKWKARYPSDMGQEDALQFAREVTNKLGDLDIVEGYESGFS